MEPDYQVLFLYPGPSVRADLLGSGGQDTLDLFNQSCNDKPTTRHHAKMSHVINPLTIEVRRTKYSGGGYRAVLTVVRLFVATARLPYLNHLV